MILKNNNYPLTALDQYEGFKEIDYSNKEALIKIVKDSKLRGRGGANFPTGIKLESVYNELENEKYIICNADEGEPGNFKDKYLMENNPYLVIEGIIILGTIIKARKAYIYIREEYDKSKITLLKAINEIKDKGLMPNFDIELRYGAGSYLCGEEFALISSIEGKIGKTRIKPPFPTKKGLFDKPTLVLNVETLANIPFIINNGAETFKEKETKLISLSGNLKNKGVFEIAIGTSIKKIIEEIGQPNVNIKYIQLGGPSGPIIPYSLSNSIIDIEELEKKDLTLGSGAIIAISEEYDLFDILINNISFFKYESCGKCTPCREGLMQVLILLKKFKNKKATKKDLTLLEDLVETIKDASFCGLGSSSVTSVISSIKYFKEEFEKSIESEDK